ncbi:MAG: choice-of-anchor Q domain-containing protein, partial [Thermodesulfobacteriota bacterium]
GLHFSGTCPTLKNNIIAENDGHAIFADDTSSTDMVTHNNLWNNSQGDYINVNSGDDIDIVDTNGNISVDPLFAGGDPFDYHLTQDSPCIDAGTSEGAPDSDFEGDARPSGAGFDIGADEFLGLDTDGDGTPDNEDGCPNDPDKIDPGACGCGVPDTDSDDDGIADCVDPYDNNTPARLPDSDIGLCFLGTCSAGL